MHFQIPSLFVQSLLCSRIEDSARLTVQHWATLGQCDKCVTGHTAMQDRRQCKTEDISTRCELTASVGESGHGDATRAAGNNVACSNACTGLQRGIQGC